MYISKEAIQTILGIQGEVAVSPLDMARSLKVTFFPYVGEGVTDEVKKFRQELESSLKRLGVHIIPYEDTLGRMSIRKFLKWYLLAVVNSIFEYIRHSFDMSHSGNRINFEIFSKIKKGRKIKKGIAIIAMGEGKEGDLPMDYAVSFRESLVVTILDMPGDISRDTDFLTHYNIAMNLFAHNMTNIVVGVNKENWLLYNFNASHPMYSREENLDEHILHALIPKLAAPMRPPQLKEFIVRQEAFDQHDEFYRDFVKDLAECGPIFQKTNLYPPGKSIHDLPFRNEFYRWVGRIHLDQRNGMSYGFLARQLPSEVPCLAPLRDATMRFHNVSSSKDFFIAEESIYLILRLPDDSYYMKVPDVWVLSQRSGSNKTNFNPEKDLVKLGLSGGRMILETPKGLRLQEGYRPSYDTRVILAHAVGNVIIGAMLHHIFPQHPFPQLLQEHGVALAHWHGYFNPEYPMDGFRVYGKSNPHVSCSTAQSALFALDGKIKALFEDLNSGKNYLGDIHIEPHHGINITTSSLKDLSNFLLKNPNVTALGNKYF